jgi:hypothetical protein
MLRTLLLLAPIAATLASTIPLTPARLTQRDVPDICQPPDRNDEDNAYVYIDMSESCKSSGNCYEACVTFIRSAPPPCAGPYDDLTATDLQFGINEQDKKDGQLETTTSGPWTFSFALLLTTAIPNQEVRQEYMTAIMNYLNDGYGDITPATIYFQDIQAADAGTNTIKAQYLC